MEIIEVNCDSLIDHVVLLADEIWTEHYVSIVEAEQIEYMLERFQSAGPISAQIKQGFKYYLISSQNQYAGYFAILPKPDEDEMFLSKFYVKSSFRGKGLGRFAMNFIEQQAIKNKLSKITLTVNKHNTKSIEIYHKLGYKKTKDIIQDIGQGFVMDDYQMTKKLQ